ncbi:LLM class flavin-dependent oxidoreductase, partial [Streptomyces sp. SID89]|nr:LLM class flavin-dependent oxidoreductase [Streptomyces sp. SID89]
MSGGRSGGDRSADDGRSGDGPYDGRSAGGGPYDGRSAGGGPSGDRLSGGRPSGGRTGGGHSVGDRAVGGERLHQVDFTGGTFSVRGPSAVPRPPQGHPVRVVDATEGHARATAARYADVVLVRAASPAQAAALRDQLRTAAAGFGRDPDTLRVLASLVVDLGDGEYAAERGHG